MSHPANAIHPSAQLIGDIELGEGNTIGPLAVLMGPLTLGSGNWLGTGVVIGAPPEVRGWRHPTDITEFHSGNGVQIGDGNVFREYVQVHQGWEGTTRVGNDVFAMNQTYIAHDCQIEDGVTLASSVLLAGHVHIGASANLGLGTSVHQRRYVGRGAMIGMGSVVTRDVPPYAKAFGNPARTRGANTVGMQRSGIEQDAIDAVSALYADGFTSESLLGLEGMPGIEAAIADWRRCVVDRASH